MDNAFSRLGRLSDGEEISGSSDIQGIRKALVNSKGEENWDFINYYDPDTHQTQECEILRNRLKVYEVSPIAGSDEFYVAVEEQGKPDGLYIENKELAAVHADTDYDRLKQTLRERALDYSKHKDHLGSPENLGH
jgi:hypothetical protein